MALEWVRPGQVAQIQAPVWAVEVLAAPSTATLSFDNGPAQPVLALGRYVPDKGGAPWDAFAFTMPNAGLVPALISYQLNPASGLSDGVAAIGKSAELVWSSTGVVGSGVAPGSPVLDVSQYTGGVRLEWAFGFIGLSTNTGSGTLTDCVGLVSSLGGPEADQASQTLSVPAGTGARSGVLIWSPQAPAVPPTLSVAGQYVATQYRPRQVIASGSFSSSNSASTYWLGLWGLY